MCSQVVNFNLWHGLGSKGLCMPEVYMISTRQLCSCIGIISEGTSLELDEAEFLGLYGLLSL